MSFRPYVKRRGKLASAGRHMIRASLTHGEKKFLQEDRKEGWRLLWIKKMSLKAKKSLLEKIEKYKDSKKDLALQSGIIEEVKVSTKEEP